MGLTFIARPYQEDTLLWICLWTSNKIRKLPETINSFKVD
jgi:hypothetical protein